MNAFPTAGISIWAHTSDDRHTISAYPNTLTYGGCKVLVEGLVDSARLGADDI
jgi:hypothetical protein